MTRRDLFVTPVEQEIRRVILSGFSWSGFVSFLIQLGLNWALFSLGLSSSSERFQRFPRGLSLRRPSALPTAARWQKTISVLPSTKFCGLLISCPPDLLFKCPDAAIDLPTPLLISRRSLDLDRAPVIAFRRMPGTEKELLTVAGREVAISNPRKVLFPAGRLHQAAIWRATTSRSPTARCAARAAGPTCSSAIPTASTASSSTRSARRARGRRGSRSSRCGFRPAAAPRKSCRAMPPRWRGWRTSPASSCIRIRCAPTISIIPTSCASISIRCPASSWPQIREVARVVQATLDDFGLVGWPKTSGSRGMHVYVRIEPRWTFDRGAPRRAGARARGRAARAGARHEQVVEGRAPRRLPRLQPEREGPHGGQRLLGAADARRARVGAARLGRDRRLRARRLHAGDDAGAVRARWAIGTRRSTSIRARSSALLELSARQEREGLGDAPWPPHYGKQRGEPPRVAAVDAGAHGPKFPLIEIGARAEKKADALAGLERWKARHPEAAAHLAAGRRAGRRDARPLSHLDAHPRQPAARARGSCVRRRRRSILIRSPTTGPRGWSGSGQPDARFFRLSPHAHSPCRFPLCPQGAGPDPVVCVRGHRGARARHRRQHGDLQHRQRRTAEAAALRGAGSARAHLPRAAAGHVSRAGDLLGVAGELLRLAARRGSSMRWRSTGSGSSRWPPPAAASRRR